MTILKNKGYFFNGLSLYREQLDHKVTKAKKEMRESLDRVDKWDFPD